MVLWEEFCFGSLECLAKPMSFPQARPRQELSTLLRDIRQLEHVEPVAIVKSKSNHGCEAGVPHLEVATRRESSD